MRSAMILAAGLGTRLRPLTLTTPKPLIPLAGKPLIEYHLESLVNAGFERVVINHAWLGEQIEHHLGDGSRFGLSICYSAESEPLETAGGIRKALPLLVSNPDDVFAVINGDVFSTTSFSMLMTRTLSSDRDACLWLVDNPPWHRQGDFHLCADGRVESNGGACLTFAGISLLRGRLFTHLVGNQPEPLAPLLRNAIAAGRVGGEKLNGYWNDIGTPERLVEAEKMIQRGQLNGI